MECKSCKTTVGMLARGGRRIILKLNGEMATYCTSCADRARDDQIKHKVFSQMVKECRECGWPDGYAVDSQTGQPQEPHICDQCDRLTGEIDRIEMEGVA